MPVPPRARRALAAALAAAFSPACAESSTGCSGDKPADRPFGPVESTWAFPLDADGQLNRVIVDAEGGLAQLLPESIDPAAAGACEEACAAAFALTAGPALELREIDACTLEAPAGGDTGAGDTGAGDTGAGDTGAGGTGAAEAVTVRCTVRGVEPGPVCIGGRASAAVAPPAPLAAPTAAAWLAREATAEAASVRAFLHLARELRALGAPAHLIAAAQAAARDEVRHARAVAAAARARGARPRPAAARPLPLRPLPALAAENAVEGCVHETWAAARAAWMARHAPDPALRALFAALAADEARHADLADAVHAWARAQLPAPEAAALDARRRAAWERLAAGAEPPVEGLGLPGEEERRVMIGVLRGLAAG